MKDVDWKLLTELWRKYVVAKSLDDVPRGGFPACGTGKVQPKQRWVRNLRRWLVRVLNRCLARLGEIRLETDGGHSFGLVLLAYLVHVYLPEHLPLKIYILVSAAGIYHELGEIVYGDRLDDGSQDLLSKNNSEAEVIREYFRGVPDSEYLERIIIRAEDMQVRYEEVDLSNELDVAAWWLKALDKTEAVLQNGRYRMMNAVGRIGQKDNPSKKDLASIEELGTDDIVFIWAFGSAKHLMGTVLWKLMVAMMMDIYDIEEIPVQFFTP